MANSERIYKATILEMLRVVRPGGRIIVLDDFNRLIENDASKRPTMQERILRELGIGYRPLQQLHEGKKEFYGAVIIKPA